MLQIEKDEFWISRCLQLAKNGELTASPAPLAGACIVYEDRILGEGWNQGPRLPHAEAAALRAVAPQDQPLLSQATLFVTLEPCVHHGRGISCTDLIIRQDIKRVVIGALDRCTKQAGKGIERLEEAGIEVTTDVLRDECLHLNRKFLCNQVLNRPYITLKWTTSADHFLDKTRSKAEPSEPAALSTPLTQIHLHHLRAAHQAILIGRKTFELNHPALNVRHYAGNNPLRCVLGGVGEEALNAGYQAYADIDSLLEGLRREGIHSLLVEGGAQTLQSFIERDLWDEAWEEHSPVVLREGIPAPEMPDIFPPSRELHFGSEFFHWESPVLQKNYIDF